MPTRDTSSGTVLHSVLLFGNLFSDLSCGLCWFAEIGWRRWHTKSKPLFVGVAAALTCTCYNVCVSRAESGDYSVLEELTALLERPYDNTPHRPLTADVPTAATEGADGKGTPASGAASDGVATEGSANRIAVEDKWYQKTPDWARDMPGLAFMS
jgi:hypothetical protein